MKTNIVIEDAKLFVQIAALVLIASPLCAQTFQTKSEQTAKTDSVSRANVLDSLVHWRSTDSIPNSRYISFNEFLATVAADNLDYAVQKYNISIAQAQVIVAQLYPDPSLSVGFTTDVTPVPADQKFGNVWSVGASETILLGGKIGDRQDVAEKNMTAAQAQTEDFFRNLRATAAQAYIAALVADSDYKENERSYVNLAGLAHINEERVSAGDLGKTDLIQSRVDAIQARGAVLQADATRRQAFIQLSHLMSRRSVDTVYRPMGSLTILLVSPHIFILDSLIARAKATRPDVIAARRAVESARFGVDLAHAERWPDLTVGAGYTYSGASNNTVSPFPGEQAADVSLSIPLPISDLVNHGSIDVAQFTYEQAQKSLEVAELSAENDVRQGYSQYLLSKEQFEQFSGDMIADAEKVRAARLYSYKAGSASLLDVLTAENTLASVYLAYYGTLSGYANALVTLEQAAGMWDVEF